MKSFLAVVIAISSVSFVQAQSLVDAAKKAQDERDKAKPTQTPGTTDSSGGTKVYTNEDLSDEPLAATSANEAKTPAATKAEKTDGHAKGEAYWRSRVAPLQKKIDESQRKSDALRKRIAELTTEMDGLVPVNPRPGSVASERQKLITQADRLEAEISAEKKALGDIEEEGRRAGALPAWFR
jgi:septal ring factor EnvC (AmiA/AmiB activator)